MTNAEIAAHLDELGDLYELDGAIVHRVVAYRNAARAVRDAARPVAELAREGRATELPGVGKTIQEKIVTLLDTGEIPSAVKLKKKFPAGLVEITRIPGFGPKRARKLYEELGIASIDALREAAEQERLRDVRGFGAKAEESILAALAEGIDGSRRARILVSKARAIGQGIVDALRDHPAAERVELAGSARRWAETCKDLDVVAASTDAPALVKAFHSLKLVEVSSSGEAGARGVTYNGMPVDLRVVEPHNFGNLLQHFTGSGRHNEALRTEAVRRGFHVSEYGVEDPDGVTHACADEDEVYRLLGMEPIPPELREDRGELQAAREGRLPELIDVGDLRGELHCHTVASDGRNTVEEMALTACDRGLEYIAITDHSASHGFGNEVSPDALRELIAEVREVDSRLEGIRVLAGSEVNIHTDGSLDYEDDLLAELDWIVASLHTSFRMGREAMTERMVRAMEHPLVDAVGHPTGRLIERREAYPLDLERVFDTAARTGTFIEINGNPNRRDLHEMNARQAVEQGVTLVITSDAHGVETQRNSLYGVATARRGWIEPRHVANTRPWGELDAMRKRGARARAG